MTAHRYLADDAPTPAPTTGAHRRIDRAESSELVRLRVLWYALRARGIDACGAPGIAYDRPVVQTSPTPPTVPHGYGMGHARDPVAARLDELAGTEAAVTLRWYRSYDATGAWASGSVEAILDACVRALATAQQLAAWTKDDGAAQAAEGTGTR